MIYKTLKKVSDYCQILDKSKFSATQTINGVTFTNNGDGSITVNGTASSKAIFTLVNTQVQISRGSKFCLNKPLDTEVYGKFWFEVGMTFADGITHYKADTENSVIEIKRDNVSKIICYIAVGVGYTVNNITFKPQLFDLTEMYGAGNEPTTVEQFRTKFPNELYDYKPYCFVKSYKTLLKATDDKIITSYKKSLACKTKNLFDYTKVNGLEHTSTGNPYSNYLKINGESFGVMAGLYDRGVNFIPHFILDAGTYTMSLIAKGTSPGDYGQFGIIKFNSDGTKPSFTKQWVTSDSRQSYTFTLDENSEIAIRVQAYGNASNAKNLDSTFSNIQLELGDTATEYHPYGYL